MRVVEAPTQAERFMTGNDRPAITARTAAGYRTEIAIRDHHLIADEPVEKGGTDTGPTPSELMSAALAGCTSVTMRMYADRKEWPVREITVSVRHHSVNEKDRDDPDGRPRRVDLFDVTLTIDGDLTPEQTERLVYIAGRCPVKRALDGHSRIVTVVE